MSLANALDGEDDRRSKPRICIASHFNGDQKVFSGLCYEAANAMADACGGYVLSPSHLDRWQVTRLLSSAKHGVFGGYPSKEVPIPIEDDIDLFIYMGINARSLLTLNALPGWKERSARKVAFLYETWSSNV